MRSISGVSEIERRGVRRLPQRALGKMTMNQKSKWIREAVLFPAILYGMLSMTAVSGGEKGKGLAVIVSPKIGSAALSMGELRKIFQGDKPSWPSGQKVTVLMPSDPKERDIVLKKIYQMTDAQYKQYWIAKVFRSEASGEPKSVSDSSAGEIVKSSVGAIACVDADSVPSGVKTLKIDGKAPGESGYLVQ